MKHRASTAIALLLICSSAQAGTGPTPADPGERRYLDLQARYSLEGLGVDLSIAVSHAGQVTISSASQGRLWRLQQGRLLRIADQPRCPQGQRLWPATIIDGGNSPARLWLLDVDARRVLGLNSDSQPLACYRVAALMSGKAGTQARQNGITQPPKQLMMTLSPSQARPTLRRLPPDMAECVMARPAADNAGPGLYCINAQRTQVVGLRHQQAIASFTLPGSYPRAAGLALDGDGSVTVSDAAAARLYRLNPALDRAYRLPLYESEFRSPGRLQIRNGRLWLIDEGRQQLLQFSLRRARSALDHQLLGEEFLSLGLYRQALAELQRGAAGPLLLGQAQYGLGHYRQALAQFTAAASDTGKQALASFWRANSLFRLGRLDAALTAYQQAAQQAGQQRQVTLAATINHAQTLLALGRYPQAEAAFGALLKQAPENPAIRLGVALAALGRGDERSAITRLSALRDDPLVGRQARHYLGLALLASGAAQQALPLLQQAAREGPHYREALAALARAQIALGRSQQAAQTRTTLKRLPQRAAALDAFIIEDPTP